MKKTKLFALTGGVIFIAFLFSIGFILPPATNNTETGPEDGETRLKASGDNKQVSIAVCPTFYYMFEGDRSNDWINVVKTGGTGESLIMLENGFVDIAVSGRPLKEEEPDFLFEIVGRGYDFIFKEAVAIPEEKMQFVLFYTDINEEDIIKDFRGVSKENLLKIDEIDSYLDKSVIITLLDGKMIGESAYVLNADESRVRMSRRPRMYYWPALDEDTLASVRDFLREN